MQQWVDEKDIEFATYTWEDFLEAPIGTKITFENETLVKTEKECNPLIGKTFHRDYNDLKNFTDNCGSKLLGKIIRIEEPTYTTIYEPTEQVEEMTLEEVCKELGREIKIIKEK